MMIVPIPVKEASRKWKRLKSYIASGCSDRLSMTYVHKKTNSGDFLLAEVIHNNQLVGGVLFELLDDRLHIVSLGADGMPKNWHREFFNQWLSLARVFKRNKLSLNGRRGWQRVLKPLGFKLDIDGDLIWAA